jgi:uncharacterized protein YegP (UPF0339 family)
MAAGRCSTRRLNALDKQSRAWKMRLDGHNWQDIAEAIGYKSGKTAKNAVDSYRLHVIQSDKESVENERDRVTAFIQKQITELRGKIDWETKTDFSLKVCAEIRQLTDQLIKIQGLIKPPEEKKEGFSIPITLSLPQGININLPSLNAPHPDSIITHGEEVK